MMFRLGLLQRYKSSHALAYEYVSDQFEARETFEVFLELNCKMGRCKNESDEHG